MNKNYRNFFGLKKEPFGTDLKIKEVLETDELKAAATRFDYAVGLGAMALVTGEIGSGKSTALRYCADRLHPSEYKVFYVTATSGSILELYRQITAEMGISQSSNSRAVLTRMIRNEISELVDGKKMKVALIVDEASLLRLEVLSELHTLCQFHKDSKPWLPLILSGQASLIDKMMYRASAPLASRIVARSHMQGLNRQGMQKYLEHHLTLAGVNANLFEDAAVTAIHQGSGGILRKANHLARGALIGAATKESMIVTAEHVRLAATEIF
jgi:type II secretory pathway predicted ATPase ExeA